jgi:MFS family permease
MLILAHICLGLAMAFVSGADSALIYDTLLFLKREKDYKKVQGRAMFFGEIAIIFSAIIGSLIVVSGIRQTILFTMIGYSILVFVAFSLIEPPRKIREKHKIHLEIAQLFSIINKSLSNKKLLGLFLYSFIILAVSNTIFIIYQPYFRATSVPLIYYGYIFAAFSIFAALTSLKAHQIEQKLGVYWSLLLMPIFLACALIGASSFS